MKKKTFFSWIVFLSITVCLLWGCSGKGIKTTPGDPEILYKQGLIQFNKRDYGEALKKFEQLKASFPDSPPFTVWAELKIGDCHFLKGSYVEAIAAYEEFKKIHPTYEEIPYVQYQIASAYFKEMLTLDRDQTFTQKALSNFEYLIANYPTSLFAERARQKIGVCRKRLADHEFYIGSYYYRRGKFQAAAVRFQGLIEKFPTMPDTDKALFLMGKSYLELNQGGKAVEAFNKIVNEYPKSTHHKEARSLLDRGIKEKAITLPKTKTKESKKKEEKEETEPGRVYLAKFDDEGRQAVFVAPSPPVTREPARAIPPREKVKTLTPSLVGEPVQEDGIKAISPPLPQETKPAVEVKPEEEKSPPPLPALTPIPPAPREISSEAKETGKRIAALPSTPVAPLEKPRPQAGALPEPGQGKLMDSSQPIDITSDRVEAYSKENRIIFRGNVTARQKDIVIYADSLETMVIEGGKGIEKVIAGGNVKIQQGLRVANCQKAVFHNVDQTLILTGDPKVWEGNNMVSGDEIVFHIEQDRIEVKGGPGGRGKAKILPEGGLEGLK